jgi:hypothetical protein
VDSLREELETRVRALPGVDSVGTGAFGMMRGTGLKGTVAAAGQTAGPSDFLNTSLQLVTPGYFDSIGIRVVAGRLPTLADADRKPAPVAVNETFARHFFPGLDPVGRCFGNAMNTPAKCAMEVAAVVTDAKYRSMREPIPPVYYRTFDADSRKTMHSFVLHVRTRVRPESIIQPVRETLRALDPALPFVEVRTLAEEADASLWAERLTAALSSVFGAIAAFLAAVGLYGLLAYSVAQRSREIGIRMALGADAGRILGLISGDALVLVGCGIALGLGAALTAGPAVRGVLYGVQPADPPTLALAAALVGLTPQSRWRFL